MRIIISRAPSTIRPGRLMRKKRIAFILFTVHESLSTSCFIAELRFMARTIIHHQAAFSPKSEEGSFFQAKSSFMIEWASSDLPHRS